MNNWQPYLQAMVTANSNATASVNLGVITASGTNYQGLTMAPNRCSIPVNTTAVGYINPSTGTFGTFGSAMAGGYVAPVLASNGNIYCVNFYGGPIGILTPGSSPASSTWSASGPSMPASYSYSAALGTDGNIYAVSCSQQCGYVYTRRFI
jgi:hypothetical protein